MFPNRLIRQNHYTRPASIQDLLTISDDLSGNLKEFLIECDNKNLSPATISYYQQMIGWFLAFLKEGNVTRSTQILPQHITIYNLHRKDSGWKSVSIATSFRAVTANPGPMALWGLVVAGTLLAGSALAFVGLMVAVPVLGHATWHLYRKLIV